MSVPTLGAIVDAVRAEAAVREAAHDAEELARAASQRVHRPFRGSLERHSFALISEIKRASPSAGPIRPDLDRIALASDYETHGARALSILTCGPFFRGSMDDLRSVRPHVSLPVLCKDFLVTPFQIREAAAAGADAVLLIAAALSDDELQRLAKLARSLGLEILFEAHDSDEVERLLAVSPDLLGVNSRNLKTMEVRPEDALTLGDRLPDTALGIFESGVKSADDIRTARSHGYRAALVGESLLRHPTPGRHLESLVAAALEASPS